MRLTRSSLLSPLLLLILVLMLLDETSATRHLRTNDPKKKAIPTGRVVGGEEANGNNYPYYVRIERNGVLVCGGTLIHPEWVLTAAHCLSTSKLKARVGMHEVNQHTINATAIDRFFPHPQYNDVYFDYMLMRLRDPVQNVQLVTLNSKRSNPKVDQELTVIGMGTDTVGAYFPTTSLREAHVKAYSNRDCARRYAIRDYDVDPDTMICAGLNAGGVDSCYGDSGGPLLDPESGDQVGIVSWGYSCGNAIYPGVYSNVYTVRDWIKKVVCESTNVGDKDKACGYITAQFAPSKQPSRNRSSKRMAAKRIREQSMHCDDAPPSDLFTVEGLKKPITCAWLAQNPLWGRKFCIEGQEPYSKCLETCGRCRDFCYDDPNETFFVFDSAEQKNCAWLSMAENRRERYCYKPHKAWSVCQETCETCNNPADGPKDIFDA